MIFELLGVYENDDIEDGELIDLRIFDEWFYDGIEERNRYVGMYFVGYLDIWNIYCKFKYYNLCLRLIWSYKGKGFFWMEDWMGENMELIVFEGFMWKIRKWDSKKVWL